VALPREYTSESCPIARSLEVIGERWTLLIIRDAFYGVRRFSDFRGHLRIPRAVLAQRLAFLVEQDVLAKGAGPNGRDEYELTAMGLRLWPTVWSLITWGNENFLETPKQRTYRHDGCGGTIGQDRVCRGCGHVPEAGELVVHPARRAGDHAGRVDEIGRVLQHPHRLLEPIRPGESHAETRRAQAAGEARS
jgi:DNA-binding HxlR family transcriptional regulator